MKKLFGERPGSSYDAAFWNAVRALYEEAFGGLPAGIDRAAAAGVRWADVTTPFAYFEGDRCVAHVGVLSHPMILDDRPVSIAGVHAVCTAADRRGRGLCRALLGEALAWADRSHELAKLHTDLPEVYAGHGFEVTPTWRFRSRVAQGVGVDRRRLTPSTDPADAALLRRVLAGRAPVSRRCASADDGWLITIDAALGQLLDRAMWWLPEHEAIVVYTDEGPGTLVVEVLGATLPPAEIVAGAAPDPGRPLSYAFSPDLFEPDAEPTPVPAANGVLMVRGAWPGSSPFGLSPLWEH